MAFIMAHIVKEMIPKKPVTRVAVYLASMEHLSIQSMWGMACIVHISRSRHRNVCWKSIMTSLIWRLDWEDRGMSWHSDLSHQLYFDIASFCNLLKCTLMCNMLSSCSCGKVPGSDDRFHDDHQFSANQDSIADHGHGWLLLCHTPGSTSSAAVVSVPLYPQKGSWNDFLSAKGIAQSQSVVKHCIFLSEMWWEDFFVRHDHVVGHRFDAPFVYL